MVVGVITDKHFEVGRAAGQGGIAAYVWVEGLMGKGSGAVTRVPT